MLSGYRPGGRTTPTARLRTHLRKIGSITATCVGAPSGRRATDMYRSEEECIKIMTQWVPEQAGSARRRVKWDQSAGRDLCAATAGLMHKLCTRDVSHTRKANRGLLSGVS